MKMIPYILVSIVLFLNSDNNRHVTSVTQLHYKSRSITRYIALFAKFILLQFYCSNSNRIVSNKQRQNVLSNNIQNKEPRSIVLRAPNSKSLFHVRATRDKLSELI